MWQSIEDECEITRNAKIDALSLPSVSIPAIGRPWANAPDTSDASDNPWSSSDLQRSLEPVEVPTYRLSEESVLDAIRSIHYYSYGVFTVCFLTLVNGFIVTGESAVVDPGNFDADTGRMEAYENALDKVRMLEGYRMKQRMYEQKEGV